MDAACGPLSCLQGWDSVTVFILLYGRAFIKFYPLQSIQYPTAFGALELQFYWKNYGAYATNLVEILLHLGEKLHFDIQAILV